MRLLTLGGVAGPVVFLVVVIVVAALREDYSHLANFISELGAGGMEHAAIMNYAGFLPAGAMLAAFGISLAGTLPRGRLTLAGAGLVAMFGLGIAVSGIVSCDMSCPQGEGSVENLAHNRIAPVSFLCLIAAAAILAIRFRGLTGWRHLWIYSLVTSVVGLVLLATLAGSLEARTLTGLWQRLMLATLFLWCSVVGLHAYRYSKRK